MQFALFYLCIRNDDHCPTCRKHYISLHKSDEDACKEASEYLNDELLDDLKAGNIICVDEWIRRRNGDRYQVWNVLPEVSYNLAKYDMNDYDREEEEYYYQDYVDTDDDKLSGSNLVYKESSDNQESDDKTVQYMLLHVRVNKVEWCPDNINYWVSFHTSLDAACEHAPQILDSGDVVKLRKLEPVWKVINDDTDKLKGNHYQIIKIEWGKRVYLNEYCQQIQPEQW